MKLRELEGSSEEINNFFENNGLNVQDYFLPPSKPIHVAWVVFLGIVVLIGLVVMMLEPSSDSKISNSLFIVTCFFSICWAIVIHLKWKNAWATSIAVIGCLLLALVSHRIIPPEKMGQFVEMFLQ